MATKPNPEKVLISSERLILNATKEDISFKSKGITHFTAGDSIRIDIGPLGSTNSDNLFIINSPRIQFGIATKGRTVEPVIKGDALATVLGELMNYIEAYSTFVSTSAGNPQILTYASNKLKRDLSLIRMKLSDPGYVKSNITYTI
jgi:hypothetical protein